MKLRLFQQHPSSHDLPITMDGGIAAISLSANGSNEQVISVADAPITINSIRLVPNATITGAAAGAVGYFNIWRAGAQLALDGAAGAFNFAAVGANYVATAFQGLLTTATQGFAWVGSTTALTGGVSTGGTLTALAQSVLTSIIQPGMYLVVDPGLSTQESFPLATLNTGSGVYTITGTFANNHPAGALAVISASPVWEGTTNAQSAGATGGTLTAAGASTLTQLAVGQYLTFDPGLATAETLPLATINTGTGVYTLGGVGKFAFAHAAGGTVLGQGNKAQLNTGDVLTFKWKQLGTGLALPSCFLDINYVVGGTPSR